MESSLTTKLNCNGKSIPILHLFPITADEEMVLDHLIESNGKVVQEVLGHANISTTLNIYAALSNELAER